MAGAEALHVQELPLRGQLLVRLLDAVFGFIPFVGDVADIAEVAYIWTTGYDKWGRPVSDFQRGLMTVGAGVPLLSSGFVGKAARLIEGRPDVLVHGYELTYLMQQAGRGMDPDIDDVEAVLGVADAWNGDKRLLNTTSRKAMTAEMLDFIKKNPALIEEWATKLVSGSGDEWLALPDILDDATGGFRINSIQVQYLKWRQHNLGGTPEQFIESGGLSGRAKVMAQALLGNEAVGGALRAARRAAKRTGYPSALGRRAIGGIGLKLAQITAEQVATKLTTYVTACSATVSKNKVVSTEALRPVTAIVSHPVTFFVDGARAMLQRLSPTTPLDQLRGNVLEALLGKDNFNGVLVSLEERAARFADALFAAYAELKDKGIAVETLFTENMLPVTMTFVRSFIARAGKENGARFELRIAAFLEIELRPPLVISIRHQLKLPTLLKKGPCPDPTRSSTCWARRGSFSSSRTRASRT